MLGDVATEAAHRVGAVCPRVVLPGKTLQHLRPHQLHAQVGDPLVRGQQVAVDEGEPVGDALHLVREQLHRYRLQHEADRGGIRPGDRVTGELEALRPLGPLL